VSDYLITPGITLVKFGRPVLFRSDQKVGKLPHIRFVQYDVKGSVAKASLEYKVEGLHAAFTLTRTSTGSWRVRDADLHEE
jgi:hypothetical protein